MHSGKWLFLLLAGAMLLSSGCDKVEGEGGGVVSPTESDPYIIESVFCVNVYNDSKPVLITSVFYQDDYVYLWIRWGNVEETHTVTSEWFDPDGSLQAEVDQEFTAQGGGAITWFYLDTTSSAPLGEWWVDIYLDGEFMRSQIFMIVE